jgi:hypothetical protein
MSLELWGTIGSIATFLVIGVTAVAALVQLRHIRRANQLAGLQSIFAMLQDPGVRELINYVRHDLANSMKDQSFRDGLLAVPVDRRKHPEMYLCDIYNHVGSFVRSGLIDESVYLQTDWYNVRLYWGLLSDTVSQTRRNARFTFENFEWLAARAQRWIEQHPNGDYPEGEARMLPRDLSK